MTPLTQFDINVFLRADELIHPEIEYQHMIIRMLWYEYVLRLQIIVIYTFLRSVMQSGEYLFDNQCHRFFGDIFGKHCSFYIVAIGEVLRKDESYLGLYRPGGNFLDIRMVHIWHCQKVISQELDLDLIEFLQVNYFERQLLFGELVLDHVNLTYLPLK